MHPAGLPQMTDMVLPNQARPDYNRLISIMKLDVSYVAGARSTLVAEHGGRRFEVLDYSGGFGSLALGHNPPAVLATVQHFLAGNGVVHAQGSYRPAANQLVEALNRYLTPRVGISYAGVCTNSGAESVEVALKHAAMVTHARVERVKKSKVAVEGGFEPFERRAFIAVARSFHGKTSGALAATFNPELRDPFGGLGPKVYFIRPDRNLDQQFAEILLERTVRYQVPDAVGEGMVLRSFLDLSGIIFEPIQGEGGVLPLHRDVIDKLVSFARRYKLPLICDEIQTGLGRTGTMFACEGLGIEPDYLLLGKSLGGGLAKIGVTLIKSDFYRDGFGVLHSSTFAEDELSCRVALTALAEVNRLLSSGVAEQTSRHLKRVLWDLRSKFPEIVADVRGAGAMWGMELAAPLYQGFLACFHDQGQLGYLVSSYLLHHHGVRIMPCFSNPNVLRIQPPLDCSFDEIQRFSRALENTLTLLRANNAAALMAHFVERSLATDKDFRRSSRSQKAHKGKRVGFVGYFIEPSFVSQLDSSFAEFSDDEIDALLGRFAPIAKPAFIDTTRIQSKLGLVSLQVYGLLYTSRAFKHMMENDHHSLLAQLQAVTNLAEQDGCTIAGFGALTSVATVNCLKTETTKMGVTSGNALTTGLAMRALMRAAQENAIKAHRATACVVGATGNIGSIIAELLAQEVGKVILVTRTGQNAKSDRLLRHLLMQAIDQIKAAKALGFEPKGIAAVMGRSKRLAARLWLDKEEVVDWCIRSGVAPVEVTSDMGRIKEADLIVASSNSPDPIIYPEHIGSHASVVLDIAVPQDVHASVISRRPDCRVVSGGLVNLGSWSEHFKLTGTELERGFAYACLAEALILGMMGRSEHFSKGPVNKEQVQDILALFDQTGFSLNTSSKKSNVFARGNDAPSC